MDAMHNRMTSRSKPPAGGKPSARKGQTQTEQGEDQRTVPRMPHERDESADSQARQEPSNARMGKIAQSDTERGVKDTSKGAELDATYDKLRQGMPDGEKKFRP